MCGAAAIPVLKFIAPIVLPSLASRIFGGKRQDVGNNQPANFKQTVKPGTLMSKAAGGLGGDEETKKATEESEVKQSELARQKLARVMGQTNQTSAQNRPTSATEPITGLGGNISGTSQQTGGLNTGISAPAYQ